MKKVLIGWENTFGRTDFQGRSKGRADGAAALKKNNLRVLI
jgi:hypothetical protein